MLGRWRVKVALLLLSPLIFVGVLLTINLYYGPGESLPYLAYVFAFTAVLAVVVSGILTVISYKVYMVARIEYEPEDAKRLIALSKFLLQASLCIVHALFLAVGLAAVFMDELSIARIEITRLGVVAGQWVLLVSGCAAWVLHQHIRKDVMEDLETSVGDKLDQAAEIATERHAEYTDSHIVMIKEARDAATKAALLIEKQDEAICKISTRLDSLSRGSDEIR